MSMNNKDVTLLDTRCWAYVLDGLKITFKSWVREAVEEVISEKICNANIEDKRLNVRELCERWNISKGTLANWEKDGRIAPLPLGGRRKIYSMRDVLAAEADGLIRTAC